jgi:hypothetical protein
VSGSNEGLLLLLLADDDDDERGEIFLWEDITVDDVVVPLADAVVVAAAEDAGVREERLRAALIRTLTVDGIITFIIFLVRFNSCLAHHHSSHHLWEDP